MLKSTKLLFAISMVVWGFPSISNAAITKYGVTVSECDFDYENEKFCTDSRLQSYANELKNSEANFDGDKILYLFETNETGFVGQKPYRLVVIDATTKTVYPFSYALSPASDSYGNPVAVNKAGAIVEFDFNINSDRFCFSGNIDAYRMSANYEQGKPFCFKFNEAEQGLMREYY